jgi:two-component system sensor histidine kinase YesM
VNFIIEDDGIGMPQQKLDSLLVNEPHTETIGSGYGISNIHQRIRLYYGQEYGLEFSSCPGKGTTAIVTIPAV